MRAGRLLRVMTLEQATCVFGKAYRERDAGAGETAYTWETKNEHMHFAGGRQVGARMVTDRTIDAVFRDGVAMDLHDTK